MWCQDIQASIEHDQLIQQLLVHWIASGNYYIQHAIPANISWSYVFASKVHRISSEPQYRRPKDQDGVNRYDEDQEQVEKNKLRFPRRNQEQDIIDSD